MPLEVHERPLGVIIGAGWRDRAQGWPMLLKREVMLGNHGC